MPGRVSPCLGEDVDDGDAWLRSPFLLFMFRVYRVRKSTVRVNQVSNKSRIECDRL